ncbi:hypothetical protein GCM10009525_46640 [Streptosporangium amethystogenes subsp. fukuiense]
MRPLPVADEREGTRRTCRARAETALGRLSSLRPEFLARIEASDPHEAARGPSEAEGRGSSIGRPRPCSGRSVADGGTDLLPGVGLELGDLRRAGRAGDPEGDLAQ